MLLFLMAFAAEPLETYAELQLLSLVGSHKAFFAPLTKHLESTRKTSLPSECPAEAKAALRFDIAGYLTQVAAERPQWVRRFAALGLAEAKALTVCFAKKRITAVLQAKRLGGLIGTLVQTPLDFDRLVGEHYWLMRGVVDWPRAWEMLGDLDRALTGMRASRLDAAIVAASAVMDANAEQMLVHPLSGRFTLGETADGKHFAELEASDTSGYAHLFKTLDKTAPHAPFGRKKKPNEWGLIGGISGFDGEASVFVQLDPKEVRLADSVTALDRPRAFKLGQTFDAALAGTLDWQRYRKLFQRVGRPDDVRAFVRKHALGSVVDARQAPTPSALFSGSERVSWWVARDGDQLTATATF